MKLIFPLILFSMVLCGCVSFEDRVKAFGAMDCAALEQESDYYQERLDVARTTANRSAGQEIYGDERRSQEAETEALMANRQMDEAARYLAALGRVKREKGC